MPKDIKPQKEEICEECEELKGSGCQCNSDYKESEGSINDNDMEEESDEKGDEW